MKDDFYKDMEHTRREKKNEASNRRRRRTKVDPELSRSAKYKVEDKKQNNSTKKASVKNTSTTNKNKQTNKNNKNNTQNKKTQKFKNEQNDTKKKLPAGVTLTGLATGAKKSILTARDKYSKQLDSELGESKDKLKGLKSTMLTGLRSDKNKRKLRGLLLLILIPTTLLFAFMIVSNFWPEAEDYTADNSGQETEQVDNSDKREINKEFEQKKAELEKEFAALDKKSSDKSSNSSNDKQSAAREYSDSEKESMKSEADKAIEEKKSQNSSTKSSESNSEATTKVDTDTSTESESDETESDTESDSETNKDEATAVHVVNGKDNLYRIAIQYYGSGSEENVQKIRDANGISGNEISVGQELIIP